MQESQNGNKSQSAMTEDDQKREEIGTTRPQFREIPRYWRDTPFTFIFNGIKAWKYFLGVLSLIDIATLQRVGPPEENISAPILNDIERKCHSETPACFSMSIAKTGSQPNFSHDLPGAYPFVEERTLLKMNVLPSTITPARVFHTEHHAEELPQNQNGIREPTSELSTTAVASPSTRNPKFWARQGGII
ncbi:hypothetical protein QR685DRAFT_603650 [Neurospora intermedia]|uniref:Uncharacterized protein n=1 Tax=Neurospora intermedia TaxID=5142 RepID=A0ABR3DKS0_NEUIN